MWLVKNFLVIVFSLIIAVLTITLYPFDYKKKISNVLIRFWAKAVLFIYNIKVYVFGTENIKNKKGKIYISNHSSYLDIFVQLAYLPDSARMIYKKEINRVPILGIAMLCAGFIPIDRKNYRKSIDSLIKASEKVKQGQSVVIYPEGTRTLDGKVGEFKRGMYCIAEKSEAELIPVSVTNTFNLMPAGTLKVKSGKVNMVIGEPIKYTNEKELLERIRNKVIENLKPV